MNLTKGFLSYSAFQGNQEKLIDYYRRLKVKAADCGLNNEDAEIRTQIINPAYAWRLFEKESSSRALLEFGKSFEMTDEQVQRLKNGTNSVNSLQNKTKQNNTMPIWKQSTSTIPKEFWARTIPS